jgi:hypothetical protein
MIKITFAPGTLRDIENLMRSARGFDRQIRDRSEVLKKVKRRQVSRWNQNFSSEGAIYGPWPALSPNWTVPEREALGVGGTGPMLVRHGNVGIMSWVHHANEMTKDTNQAIQWNFEWSGGRDGSLAVVHQEGATTGLGTRLPPRKIWDLNPEDRTAIENLVEEWVDKIIEKYFGA